MTFRLDAMEREVRDALNAVDARWKKIGQSDAAWTRAFKDALRVVGERHGFSVCTGGSKSDAEGEWLYDMTWVKYRRDLVADIPLALESEWTPDDELMVDFQKLVESRARHRVMVFWQVSPAEAKRQVAKFIQQIRRFAGTRRGDRYLFAYYVGDSQPIEFAQHVAE